MNLLRWTLRFGATLTIVFMLSELLILYQGSKRPGSVDLNDQPRRETRLRSDRVSPGEDGSIDEEDENINSTIISTARQSRDRCHVVHSKLSTCNKLPNYFLHPRSRSYFNQSIINFWHIQKAGGSTVGHCFVHMTKQLKLPKSFHGGQSCQKKYSMLAERSYFTNTSHNPIIRGHGTLGLCDFIQEKITKRKCSTIAIFRDPFDRAVSQYFFNRQVAARNANVSSGMSKAVDLNITEWLKQTGSVTLRGFATEWEFEIGDDGREVCKELDSSVVAKNVWRPMDGELQDIIDNLDRHISMVALMEDLATSFEMLEWVYGLPFTSACDSIHTMKGTYENTAGKKQDNLKVEAKQQLMEDKEIVKLLQFDILLYRKVREIFNQQKNILKQMKSQSKRRNRSLRSSGS